MDGFMALVVCGTGNDTSFGVKAIQRRCTFCFLAQIFNFFIIQKDMLLALELEGEC